MNEVKMINHNEFDSIFGDSTYRSPFERCDYSSMLNEDSICFVFIDDVGIVCGIILYLEHGKVKPLPLDFIPYNQVHILPGLKLGTARCLSGEKSLIAYVAEQYGHFEYISNPKNSDVRSALFLEHDNNRINVTIKLRYTASLNLRKRSNIEEVRLNYKARRRNDIKKARGLGYNISNKYNKHELKSMYVSTFKRQDIELSAKTLRKFERIVEYAQKNNGYVVMVRDANGDASSAAVCVTDVDTAYSVFILNQQSKIYDGCSSLCMDAAIDRASNLDLAQFDFLGANSPGRGDFKLSFGADLVPYYHLGVTFA